MTTCSCCFFTNNPLERRDISVTNEEKSEDIVDDGNPMERLRSLRLEYEKEFGKREGIRQFRKFIRQSVHRAMEETWPEFKGTDLGKKKKRKKGFLRRCYIHWRIIFGW